MSLDLALYIGNAFEKLFSNSIAVFGSLAHLSMYSMTTRGVLAIKVYSIAAFLPNMRRICMFTISASRTLES